MAVPQIYLLASLLFLQAPPPPIHRSHESISAAVCVKENSLRTKESKVGMKETNKSRMNDVQVNEINDCMKEITSMQQMRATTPQVLTIVLIWMKIDDKSN